MPAVQMRRPSACPMRMWLESLLKLVEMPKLWTPPTPRESCARTGVQRAERQTRAVQVETNADLRKRNPQKMQRLNTTAALFREEYRIGYVGVVTIR